MRAASQTGCWEFAFTYRTLNTSMSCLMLYWAARYNTWLLNNSMPKGVVFSFLDAVKFVAFSLKPF